MNTEPTQTPSLSDSEILKEIKKWNWGAFLFGWIWGIGNGVWIALLTLIPFFGIIMSIILGIRGNEWAWKKKQWKSIEHFKQVQKKWAWWAVGIYAFFFLFVLMTPKDDQTSTAADSNENVNKMPAQSKPKKSQTVEERIDLLHNLNILIPNYK